MVDTGLLAIVALVVSIFSASIAAIETYITKRTVDIQKQELEVHKQEVEDTKKRFSVEQEQRKKEERQRNIREHIDRLVHRLNLQANPTKGVSAGSQHSVGWARTSLRTSEDKKEWLEHFLTGHPELYDLFTAGEQLEKDNGEAYNSLRSEVQTEVSKIANNLGLIKSFPKEYPSCDILNIMGQVVNRLQGLSQAEFAVLSPPVDAMSSANSVYNIVSDNTTFGYCGGDQAMAKSFASAINGIGVAGKIRDDTLAYLEQRGQLHGKDSELDKQVDFFIHGRELEGGGLGGACGLCLKWHDDSSRPEFETKFTIVREYLRAP